MGSYYYLAAQLPSLVYGQVAPMSSSVFLDLARNAMSPGDAALLDHCALDPDPGKVQEPSYKDPSLPTGSEFIDQWKEWERALRLNLARFRAQKAKREAPLVEAPEHPSAAAAAAKAAVAMDSPLEAELFLDKSRWDAINALQGINYFSENTIYAYLLKLYLLERRAVFKTEEGFAEYKGLYAAILEKAAAAASAAGFTPIIESGEPK